jgi:hypothetical protein
MSARPVFKTGATVPESGIYRVFHSAHRLPHEVTLFRGNFFPRCSKCQDEVVFELLHAAPRTFAYGRLTLYELPTVDDDQSAEPSETAKL